MRPKYYSIPEPCSEDWNKMTPTEKGAFCAKCTKEVLDCSTMKSSQIKPLIEEKKDPCVRIFQRQIDEMNFFEWFNTLTLRKQLKYLFLFAFLSVTNGFSQTEISNDDPLVSEKIEIDSADNIEQADLVEEFEVVIDPYALISVIDPGIFIYNPIIDIPTGGTVMPNPIIYGDWGVEPYEIPEIETTTITISTPEFSIDEDEISTVKNNYITVDHNNYSFFIEEDTLVFHANARKETMVRIKIKEKESNEIIFFDPIGIPEGQGEAHFPLDDFQNGAYIIILEGDVETKAIEVMYW